MWPWLRRTGGAVEWIEVGGTMGTVKDISVRSTTIETFDRTEVIVPNADLISKEVINWTLSDKINRVIVTVGVAYGSPTRRVEEIMLEVVREHEKTVSPPEPVVLFEDFGDSALVFRALFWIVMNRPMESKRVLSDLRYRLDDRFREAGITIAFPQRDIHIRSVHEDHSSNASQTGRKKDQPEDDSSVKAES